MPRTRNQPPTCSHCGSNGHTSESCPRNSYQTSAPALLCTRCTHLVESDLDSPYNITHRIITCDKHSTTAPPPAPSPPTTAPNPTPSTAAAPSPPAPPTTSRAAPSLVAGRRTRGVNPAFYKKLYGDVCALVHSGIALYDALKHLKISRGTWRPIRLLAEAILLHEESFLDRLTLDSVEHQKDALNIAKELLSLPNTRLDLLNLYQEDRSKVLKPLPAYNF